AAQVGGARLAQALGESNQSWLPHHDVAVGWVHGTRVHRYKNLVVSNYWTRSFNNPECINVAILLTND
ncbi:MAG: hypothetical protein ACKPBF_04810, partial [Actinomycetota bacterium]